MIANPYHHVTFIKSAAKLSQLPHDTGIEVAFVGRSNAGKSSALNTLTQNKRLARTSKTPGRTQLINLFALNDTCRLVDLPGYGYAKVSMSIIREWQHLLSQYLEVRACLTGVILLMDCRHPLTPLDDNLVKFAAKRALKVHILLTKSDKLSKGQLKSQLLKTQALLASYPGEISIQTFSALKKEGLKELIDKLNEWYLLTPLETATL